jgi:hypothetical protein
VLESQEEEGGGGRGVKQPIVINCSRGSSAKSFQVRPEPTA